MIFDNIDGNVDFLSNFFIFEVFETAQTEYAPGKCRQIVYTILYFDIKFFFYQARQRIAVLFLIMDLFFFEQVSNMRTDIFPFVQLGKIIQASVADCFDQITA